MNWREVIGNIGNYQYEKRLALFKSGDLNATSIEKTVDKYSIVRTYTRTLRLSAPFTIP